MTILRARVIILPEPPPPGGGSDRRSFFILKLITFVEIKKTTAEDDRNKELILRLYYTDTITYTVALNCAEEIKQKLRAMGENVSH